MLTSAKQKSVQRQKNNNKYRNVYLTLEKEQGLKKLTDYTKSTKHKNKLEQ